MNIQNKLDFLQIKEVTTDKQKINGTREFKIPMNDPYGVAIHVASFASGYVRRTKTGGYCTSWQLNETKRIFEKEWPSGYKYYSTRRILIPNKQDRLEYLISFCLKNYYIGYANKLSNGEFIPKWKHEDSIKNAVVENCTPEVKVIVNGHRYNVI